MKLTIRILRQRSGDMLLLGDVQEKSGRIVSSSAQEHYGQSCEESSLPFDVSLLSRPHERVNSLTQHHVDFPIRRQETFQVEFPHLHDDGMSPWKEWQVTGSGGHQRCVANQISIARRVGQIRHSPQRLPRILSQRQSWDPAELLLNHHLEKREGDQRCPDPDDPIRNEIEYK
jgi:hypothetical protein